MVGGGLSRNPASAYLAALQGGANPYPVDDTEIDFDMIADWHDFCAAKGLKYDRVHDEEESLQDMLSAICAAGRASPRHDGLRWGVVIDRPQALAVDHISPRNSDEFSWSRNYFDPPDGFRVTFFDETNGWEQAERVVPWPGHVGPIDLTEALEMPGKTDPDEIAIEATRRMYELIWRPDQFTAIQGGAARVATRGDQVMGSFDTLDRTQVAARVVEVSGTLVVLDEEVIMEDGAAYAIRFRQYADNEDVIGTSVLADVRTVAGTTRSFTLKTGSDLPAVGELVHFGKKSSESLALRVRNIEPGEDFSAVLHMVAAAPEIDELIDAYVPPAWNGIVGEEIDLDAIVAPAPVFSKIASGEDPEADPNVVQILLSPGSGSSVTVARFEIDHKLAASGSWSTETIPVAAGGGAINAYAVDDEIEIRARSIADDGTAGTWTAEIPHTVGSGALALPAALDEAAITVAGGMGNARITVAVPNDPAIAEIQLYRVPAGDTLDRNLHAAGRFAVSPLTTVEYVDGDATRANLLFNPNFDTATDWSTGANWTIAAGKATHSAGAPGSVSQAVAMVSGRFYRLAFTASGVSAGSVTPYLSGGSDRPGTAVTVNGQALDRIQAVTDNDTFELRASSDFPGNVDGAILFEETTSCIDQGTWDYYLEPVNASGAPGPETAVFSTSIV
ncbi:MAG: hypothetical protein CML66_14480 [Rhodobacteraceae bacterium]|nr:hypothetical protein [Paracoccaceae bacterium]MAY47515.1 hypothetical protein [Paracoccaceae bacterium]